MADESGALVELGLSQNEAKLYLLLVKSGRMKANELALKSGLQRRTVYDTLAQLENKGLAGKADVEGVQTFSPSPPSSLLSLLDEKRDAVEKILPSLSKPFEAEENTGASVLYGVAGIKTVLEDILQLRADYCVCYGQLQIFDSLPKFFPIFNEKRKKLGIKSRYILLDLPQVRERAKRIPLAEFKFIDPSALSGGVWWTYADRLVLFVLQTQPITIFIKNADLAKTFRRTFDEMFESRTQVYRGLEGMKAILERTLECKETLFIGGTGQVPLRLPEYVESRYNKIAKERGHLWRNIAHRSILKTPAPALPYHQIRYLPKHLEASPHVIWIFGNCVANVMWLKEPVAFLVEDERIAKAYKTYFEMLWKISEKA
jgi:sugar-specific transcriptional regulator TrmB